LASIGVEVVGPTNRTISKPAFDRQETGDGYRYETRFDVESDGSYTVRLVTAADGSGHDGASGQSATIAIDNPTPTVKGATVTDASDGDAIVPGDAKVRLVATVDGEQVRRVVTNLSAVGAGTVRLSPEGDGKYAATVVVDRGDAIRGGVFSFDVVATNEYGNSEAASTGQLVVDTAEPTADAGADRTVPRNATISFDASGSRDNVGVASYRWSFNNSTAVGRTVTHRFTESGPHTVELTAVDVAGNRDTDTVRVFVTNSTGKSEKTTERSAKRTKAAAEGESGAILSETASVDDRNPHVARFENASVRLVAFENGEPGRVRVERRSSVPESASSYPGVAIRPFTISVAGNESADATLVVTVDREALGGLAPERVTFSRYHDGEWQHLETSVAMRTEETVTYSVQTPGFSAFVLGAPGVDSLPAEEEATPESSESDGINPVLVGLGAFVLGLCLVVYFAHRRYGLL
ncbi:MAG: PKD domain-containing protein, partial [Haloferacaceae archaeon]